MLDDNMLNTKKDKNWNPAEENDDKNSKNKSQDGYDLSNENRLKLIIKDNKKRKIIIYKIMKPINKVLTIDSWVLVYGCGINDELYVNKMSSGNRFI